MAYQAGDLYASIGGGQRAAVDAIARRTEGATYAIAPQPWLLPMPVWYWQLLWSRTAPHEDEVPFPGPLLRYRHQLLLGYAELGLRQ